LADPAALAPLLADDGVVAADPDPGVTLWLRDVLDALWGQIVDATTVTGVWGWAAYGVLIVLGLLGVAVAGFLAVQALRTRRRAAVVPVVVAPSAPVRPLRELVEGLLAAGRTRDAARLAWIFVAESLQSRGLGRVRPDQTNGEFVDTVPPAYPGRPALARLAGDVDVLCYGPDEPPAAAVRAVLTSAEALG
jgi:hypothetical protein